MNIVWLGDAYNIYALSTLILGCIATAWLAWTQRWGEAIFTALGFALATSSGSLISMPRYVLASVGFALFFVHAIPKLPRPVLVIILIGQLNLLFAFAGEWFRGASWLV
ncbi:hypothetical protein AB4072_01230 [Microvirga sp. 2MCAF38]|uniref:hypothetical protein n=1 Tax=Microvirga sp. 2MCAF38 TaxID=3232989 RepID=UPI003F9D668B